MPIRAQLDEDYKTALKARDEVRVETIRNIRGTIRARELDAGSDLSEDAIVQLIRGLVKQRIDSIELYGQGGRQDLVDKETREKQILEAYLPAAPDAATIDKIVAAVIKESGAAGIKDMGRVMKEAISRLGPSADGKAISESVKRALGG